MPGNLGKGDKSIRVGHSQGGRADPEGGGHRTSVRSAGAARNTESRANRRESMPERCPMSDCETILCIKTGIHSKWCTIVRMMLVAESRKYTTPSVFSPRRDRQRCAASTETHPLQPLSRCVIRWEQPLHGPVCACHRRPVRIHRRDERLGSRKARTCGTKSVALLLRVGCLARREQIRLRKRQKFRHQILAACGIAAVQLTCGVVRASRCHTVRPLQWQ